MRLTPDLLHHVIQRASRRTTHHTLIITTEHRITLRLKKANIPVSAATDQARIWCATALVVKSLRGKARAGSRRNRP
jgi:hypothetical protein